MALTQLVDKQKIVIPKINKRNITPEENEEMELAKEILEGIVDNNDGIYLTTKEIIEQLQPDWQKARVLRAACKEFFERIVEEALKGHAFHSPLGKFHIIKKMVSTNKNYISWAATKKLQKETGDKTKVVYRENDYYFSFFWQRIPLKYFYVYNFNMNIKHNRRIEEHREFLRTVITTTYEN